MTDTRDDLLARPFGLAPNRAPADDSPAQQLGLAPAGDRCVACGAPLSSDQRYCVNCGERRGTSRFTVADPATAAEAAPPPPAPRRTRPSSSATFVAGVATLLLAMGVGVLIGHDTAGTARTANAPIKIDVGSSAATGAATAATTPTTSAAAHSTPGRSSTSGAKAKTSTAAAKTPPATAKKAATAAAKVLGGKNIAAPTVTVGGACSGGAGCQGKKFTGNFFGN
jgi:hypothetical protein